MGKSLKAALSGIVPQYGAYGGPDYGSGSWQMIENKMVWIEKAPPIDGMDALFRDHDKAYGLAELLFDQGQISYQEFMTRKENADNNLIESLVKYNPLSDPQTAGYKLIAAAYQAAAIAAFQKKQEWDKTVGAIMNPVIDVYGKLISALTSSNSSGSSSYASKSQSDVRGANKKTFVDPLVLDLDGDGVELIDIDKSNAMFDLDGDGFAKKTGWVGKDDGLLVLDKNNDGMVNDINELFGNKNQSGFAALSIYDTNHDGKIDSFDDVFKNLKVWQDANGDGSTQAEELKALTDYQIAAINLQNQRASTANDDGTRVTDTGSFTREDGTTGTVGDVEFELDRLYTYYNKGVTLDPRIIDLPWIKGYGYMPDLPIAMSIDTALLEQVVKAA